MDMPYIARLAPEGWIKKQEKQNTAESAYDTVVQSKDVKGKAKRSAWARLINKIYGIDLPDRDVQMQAEPWMVALKNRFFLRKWIF